MVGYLIWKLSSNFRDFTWPKFSGYNLLSLVLKDQKPFLSLTGRVPLTGGNIPQETTVCSSKGQALQFASGLDFLSIQAWRLWMEYPSRWEDEIRRSCSASEFPAQFIIHCSFVILTRFFLPISSQKTLAFPGAHAYHSRRSYHQAVNTDNKN